MKKGAGHVLGSLQPETVPEGAVVRDPELL